MRGLLGLGMALSPLELPLTHILSFELQNAEERFHSFISTLVCTHTPVPQCGGERTALPCLYDCTVCFRLRCPVLLLPPISLQLTMHSTLGQAVQILPIEHLPGLARYFAPVTEWVCESHLLRDFCLFSLCGLWGDQRGWAHQCLWETYGLCVREQRSSSPVRTWIHSIYPFPGSARALHHLAELSLNPVWVGLDMSVHVCGCTCVL